MLCAYLHQVMYGKVHVGFRLFLFCICYCVVCVFVYITVKCWFKTLCILSHREREMTGVKVCVRGRDMTGVNTCVRERET